MSPLEQQIARTLPPGMHLPACFSRLFSWIDANGCFVDTRHGRIGMLFPEAGMKAGWTDEGRPGGTDIGFRAEGNVNLKYWFGHERPEVLERLCVFAQTGREGSMAAFWLDPDGRQRIVHLGSRSGSIMVCVLADDPLDFLRLLAIGYDEICWGESFDAAPNRDADQGFVTEPNLAYREWLVATFGTSIPATGREIVAHPDDMHRADSQDPFNRWVAANVG